jgi:heat shock protein 5
MYNLSADSLVSVATMLGERPMTKDNHPLGKFELTGIAPAPRGIPQIEVTFEVDANGILQVSAEDKGTGKAEKITITSENGRLSEEEIERMIMEAKTYEEEDQQIRAKVDSRNGLESYLFNLRSSLDGEGMTNMPLENTKELLDIIDETLDWMSSNPEATKNDYDDRMKEVESIAVPLMRHVYRGAGNGMGGDEFSDEDL